MSPFFFSRYAGSIDATRPASAPRRHPGNSGRPGLYLLCAIETARKTALAKPAELPPGTLGQTPRLSVHAPFQSENGSYREGGRFARSGRKAISLRSHAGHSGQRRQGVQPRNQRQGGNGFELRDALLGRRGGDHHESAAGSAVAAEWEIDGDQILGRACGDQDGQSFHRPVGDFPIRPRGRPCGWRELRSIHRRVGNAQPGGINLGAARIRNRYR